MATQEPSVGRVVHYVTEHNGAHVPADICAPGMIVGSVDLFVKDSHLRAAYFRMGVLYSRDQTPGTWHWPEFVPPRGSGAEGDDS
jgi:hypothetical protein